MGLRFQAVNTPKKLQNQSSKISGRAFFDFGEDAGGANVVKIAGNFMIMASMEIMAEAFTLAEKNGLDRKKVADFFGGDNFLTRLFFKLW